MKAHSQLVNFYLGDAPDNQGRMIDEILSWKDEQLEDVHDYIQWLFPLKERSAFTPFPSQIDRFLWFHGYMGRWHLSDS